MADQEAVVLEALGRCGLRSLRRAWVDSVWELDFMETEPLDPRVEAEITENGLEVFNNLYESLLPFASEDQENTRSAWVLFKENDICHNALVAVLYHFIQAGEKKTATAIQKMLGLSAAGLYFLLLEIPGSVVHQVFHPVLFDKCVNGLEKCWPQDPESNRKRKKDTMKGSQGDSRGGRKRPRPTRREDSEMNDLSDEEEEAIYFSSHDLMNLRDSIILLLKNLLRLLPKFSLKDKPQSVIHCMQIFINLTSFETVPQERAFSGSIPPQRMKYVPQLAYHGLWLLCLPVHGEGGQTLRRLFQRLLSVILMVKGGEGSNSAVLAVTAAVTGARDQAIQFVSLLVDQLNEVSFPILRILLQHICAKCPDKSEYRVSAAQALVKLLVKLPNLEYGSFIDWLYKCSRNTKMSYRVFVLDVAIALLEMPERLVDASFPLENVMFLKHKFLLQDIVFSRCSDKAPTVRSKALSCLAQCLQNNATSVSEGVTELLQGSSCRTLPGTMVTAESPVNGTEASSQTRKTFGALRTIEVTDDGDPMGANGRVTLAMLRLRAADEKTNVRKSALQVLVNILKYNLIPCGSDELSTLQDRCRDPAVSVRKQALTSLTDLLQAQPHNVTVQKAWLTGLIPVVLDTESSVQGKTLECLEQLLLQNIKPCSRYREDDDSQRLTWDLLHLLTTESQDLSRYLTKAFYLLAKQDKFSSTLINNLISHTETERSASAWMVLAKVAGFSAKVDYSKILNAWDQVRRETNENSSATTGHILSVISHIAKHIPADKRVQLIDNVKSWLKEFKSPPEIISPAIDALQKLCYAHMDSPEAVQDLLNDVCGDLVSVCEEHISSVLMANSQHIQFDQELMVQHLFTLGDAAQHCPARVEKRVLLLIQSILASVHTIQNPSVSDIDGVSDSQPLSQSQPQTQSQAMSQFRGSSMSPMVRAHAFITLGKLCLQHEDLAKKCIPALARELEVSDDLAVRNNVILVICDLCVRYTNMVDRYIPNVSVCLKDRAPLIRKQTLIMLTNLLQEEFIKWKGSLFFRFVSVLVDPDPDIAKLGEFCLVHLLLKRNPVMFSQHFIECIFHFTSYEKHDKYKTFSQTERERRLFSLKGKENKGKRMKLYKFLLEHFTDEQRFSLTTKISQSILACFVDGLLPIDMDANELLSDIFEIMSCKEIKLSVMRSKPGEDIGGGDEDEMANAVMQVAQKKLISQVQKKNFIENIIPIISSLKGLLEQQRIPAARDLMNCLREMMQDYRDEIKDLFAADKQLAAELEYDMKKYEEQLEMEQSDKENAPLNPSTTAASGSPQAAAAAAGSSPTAHGRSPLSTIEEVPGGTQPCTPRLCILAGQVPRPRHKSLSTIAILNSARKTLENKLKPRSKSIGANPSTPSPPSTSSSKLVAFRSSDQQSNLSLTERAISTPEQTINNVTFGAGVSYISANQTTSGRSLNSSHDREKDVLCIRSPDKPAPEPRQWNVESPMQRRSNRRQSSGRAPLKPVQ